MPGRGQPPARGHLEQAGGAPAPFHCAREGPCPWPAGWPAHTAPASPCPPPPGGASLPHHLVPREDTGLYTCLASNGVGEGAEAGVRLVVQFPPSVRAERKQVHAGPGVTLELSCRVEGEPAPDLVWYRGEVRVQSSPGAATVSPSRHHHRHTLRLATSPLDTFGNYSCVATNRLGTARGHIEVHGRPTEAVFLRGTTYSGQSSAQLAWQVAPPLGLVWPPH